MDRTGPCVPTPPIPTIRELELTASDLGDYLAELAAAAALHEVRVKGGVEQHSEASRPDALRDRMRALCAGQLSAVQVIYTLDGDTYCDTLARWPSAGEPPGAPSQPAQGSESRDGGAPAVRCCYRLVRTARPGPSA